MAKKKHPQAPVLQEGDAQVQQIFVQYHQIANNLRTSKDRPQAEVALSEINNAPEGTQIALLKELARENHADAANVLLALNELSPLKSVRKEAKRSLIRLEGMKISPDWQPPIELSPVIGIALPSTNPPRFWKCLVTDSLDAGEAQLLCCWEQGDDYKEVRVLGFLLEFWSQGVKDFFTMVESKRSFEKFVAEAVAEMPDAPMKDCSLAKARHLLLEALDINKKRHITLPKDYLFHASLINQLILEAPNLGEDDEEDKEPGNLHGLSSEEVVTTFLESWTDNEDYETVYDLLSENSPLREGLAKDEWVERRDKWAMRSAPYKLKLDFCYERQQSKPKQWFSHLFKTEPPVAPEQKEVEVGWSIELDKDLFSPDDAPLELPAALAIYNESGRHWFWSSYTLVQENDDWRIQSVIDESMRAQELSTDELYKRVREFEKFLTKFRRTHTPEQIKQQLRDENMSDYYRDMIRQVKLVNCYVDVLDRRMRLDRSVYEEIAWRMFAFGEYERSLTYLIPLA